MNFEVNIICILVLSIIGLNIQYSEYSPGRRPRVMLKIIGSMVAFNIFDIWGSYISLHHVTLHPAIVYILTMAYFLFFALSAYFWFFYSKILHNKAFFDKKRSHIILAIPIFLLLALFVVSAFNGCLFSVTVAEGYKRGALFVLPAAISFSYILAAGISCLHFARRNRRTSSHHDLTTCAICSFITCICGILQFRIGRFSSLVIGDTVSVLLLYLHYLRNMISLDPLTQMPNRRKFLYQTAELERLTRPNEKLYFMFVDVDGFKVINDKYGHMEGDRVLKELSHIIRKFCKKHNGYCGRFGGDEFTIVQKMRKQKEFGSPEEIYELIKEKHIKTKDGTPVTVSIGYTQILQGESVSDFISRADENMYEIKQMKKGRQAPPPPQAGLEKLNIFGKPFEKMGRKVKYLTGASV